jgi:hypothetical protein
LYPAVAGESSSAPQPGVRHELLAEFGRFYLLEYVLTRVIGSSPMRSGQAALCLQARHPVRAHSNNKTTEQTIKRAHG